TSGGTAEGLGVAVYDAPNNGPEAGYVTGDYRGAGAFGATPPTSPSGSQHIFLWELKPARPSAGGQRLGTERNDQRHGLAVDGAGNVCVTGGWDPSSSIVAKLTPTLTLSWADYLGKGSSGNAVAVDGTGNVYTTGSFTGSVDFNPGSGTYILQSGSKGKE